MIVSGAWASCSKAESWSCKSHVESSQVSRCLRFVIAKHSLERILETGLPMEAPEKNRCNRRDAAPQPYSLVRFVEEMTRKVGLFRIFRGQCSRISLQLRLYGGGRSQVRTLLRPKFPANREKYREFCRFCLRGRGTMRRKPLRTRDIGATLRHQPCIPNRELQGAYQGIEFPVMGEEQSCSQILVRLGHFDL